MTGVAMLGRLATRYARRHRAQTARAVLGLLVVSLVLTTGLGLGDSLGASLERSVEERYGPIAVVARNTEPFSDTTAANLTAQLAADGHGIRGTATFLAVGSASNPRADKAEAFASLRGVASDEPDVLGPLPGGVEEPGPGEVVLAQDLADRLEARVGDALTFRAFPNGVNATSSLTTSEANGTLGTTPGPGGTEGNWTARIGVAVPADALGLIAAVRLEGAGAGAVTGILRGPSGQAVAAQASEEGLEARVLGSPSAGRWTLELALAEGSPAIAYDATILVGSAPPDLAALVVTIDATVTGIVPASERAAIAPRPSALFQLASLQEALNATGEASQMYFAAPDGRQAARLVRAILDPGAEPEGEGPGQTTTNSTWRVDAAKAQALERVRDDAGELTGFILVMGGFTIVASILLAYVLFSSLVEERRTELGIARAVGLTRGEVATTMVLEALAYSIAAAIVGIALGILVVLGLVELIDGYARQFDAPEFFAHFRPWTLPLAALGGAGLPVVTIALGSIRFSRLDPARAIRGAPEDVRVHRGLVLGLGAALTAVALLLAPSPLWRNLAYGLAGAGVATILLSRRRRGWAALVALAATLATVWSLYAFDGFPEDARELDPVLTMARALLVTLLASMVVACSPRPLEALGPAFARIGGLRRAAYVALRYMGARRVQAGLTTAMVAVVAVIVTAMGTLAAVFSGALVGDEAGYDLVGQSPFPFTTFPRPHEDVASLEASHFIPLHNPLGGARLRYEGETFREARNIRFAGVTPTFAVDNAYRLERADGYASDDEAWLAVARGEAVIPPSWYVEPGGLAVGGTLEVQVAGEWRNYTIAASLVDARRNELWMAYDHVRAAGFPQSTVVLARVAPGVQPEEVAHRLTEAYQADGLVVQSIREEAQQAADILQATVLVLQAFLFLGVFVGISSTGFLASRAVHERTREVGTLRALGYEAGDVARTFVVESVAVALVGLVVGIAVGLTVAHAMWWRGLREFAAFEVPLVMLVGFAALVLGLTALASWAPARRASKLEPALALRTTE